MRTSGLPAIPVPPRGVPPVSRPFQHHPAAQHAYAMTKELILSGQLPGGSLISEGEIAERADVSRTPVREAFLRLQAEDLLQLFPKRGAVVVPVAPGEAEDVLELREALETAAVRRIARGREPLTEVVSRLSDLIGTQREHTRRGDLAAFAEADEAFHRGIVAASGNVLAERFYITLGDRQRRMIVQALHPRPHHQSVLADEHARLLELINARDPEGFAHTLRAHLDATYSTMTGR
jgi:DNA-binding GntR family transcriptional regulator